MTEHERLLDELRPVAFAIAYRMLGSVSEAEDVMQEALLRVHQALEAGERIASARAFTATVTTRLAINELRSARARRERYVGEWLPEPIITDGRDDPAPVRDWLPALARKLGAKKPMRVPRFVGRLFGGEAGTMMMTEIRGASNDKAKRELGWRPAHQSWRQGLAAA